MLSEIPNRFIRGHEVSRASSPTNDHTNKLATKRSTSTARSIAFDLWIRRFVAFLVFDVLLILVVAAIFFAQCYAQLPVDAFDEHELVSGTRASWSGSLTDFDSLSDPNGLAFVVTLPDGSEYTYPVAEPLIYLVPIMGVTLFAQLVALITSLGDTRRIRRALKPLNDLALSAELMGAGLHDPIHEESRETLRDPVSETVKRETDEKITSLEQAILNTSARSAHTTIAPPHITTGDKDLRSIEVALNGLLRQMHEAQIQQVQFVSDVSHELRTPISVIKGYIGILERWGMNNPDVLAESIESLKEETDHMQQLVEELLFLARTDSALTVLQCESVNVAAILRETYEDYRFIDAKHTYVCPLVSADEYDPDYVCNADRALIKQVLRALVDNAVRYSEEKTTITLSARGTSEKVSFVVQDEGMGIGADQIAHVFERFWRSDDARNRVAEGTGLGLAIVSSIVTAHKGRIDVVSRVGVGTRITVSLPKETTPSYTG